MDGWAMLCCTVSQRKRRDVVSTPRSIRWSLNLILLALILGPASHSAYPAAQAPAGSMPAPVQLTAKEDLQRLMDLLHITSLRRGADGRNAQAPNAANYDESKANPYPNLPDPLVLKNGRKVTTAAIWWDQRRREIVEDFDREIYGRLPKDIPKVRWEVIKATNEMNGDVP